MKNNFAVIKYFKELYKTFKTSEEICITNGKMIFPKNQFYLMVGEIKVVDDDDDHFSKWVQEKTVLLNSDEVFRVKGTVGKNVNSIEHTDEEYVIDYKFREKDKTETDSVFKCKSGCEDAFSDISNKIEKIESKFTKEFTISDLDIFDVEILSLYLDEKDNLVTERSNKRLIDIPIKRLFSVLQDMTSAFVKISEIDDMNRRYIAVGSENEFAKITQIFLTV